MAYLFGGAFVLVVLVVLGRGFIAADPRSLVRLVRYGVGAILIVIGAFLVLAERWGLALPFIAFGISAISIGRIGPIDLGGGHRSSGTSSSVQSAYLEMQLDHDSATMTGRVRGGQFEGRSLDDLDEAALKLLYAEISQDAESLTLLEAYLDRRIPGWRDDVEGDQDAGPGSPADAGPMTDKEAYEVLGLAPGAGEAEIRAAHRRLMMGVHPDQGGSTFLAAKINEAKDRLLGRHRSSP